MTTQSCPDTRPTPVMIPASDTTYPYISQAASADNSSSGVPGSTNALTRSRASSLPRPSCFLRAAASPPSRTRASRALSSSTCARMDSAAALNSALVVFSLDLITELIPKPNQPQRTQSSQSSQRKPDNRIDAGACCELSVFSVLSVVNGLQCQSRASSASYAWSAAPSKQANVILSNAGTLARKPAHSRTAIATAASSG